MTAYNDGRQPHTVDLSPLHPSSNSNTMSLANKLSITDVPLADKKVLIRVDFNVPLQDGQITNNQVRLVIAFRSVYV